MSENLHTTRREPLALEWLQRVRRNHGLEHATLHVLARKNPRSSLAGHSDFGGFWIVGNISGEEVQAAAQEALQRIKLGERHLVLHPNCGTNLLTTAVLAGSAGALGLAGAGRRVRDKLDRLPVLALLASLAVLASQPLGFALQRDVTTSSDLENLEIIQVAQKGHLFVPAIRVLTRG